MRPEPLASARGKRRPGVTYLRLAGRPSGLQCATDVPAFAIITLVFVGAWLAVVALINSHRAHEPPKAQAASLTA